MLEVLKILSFIFAIVIVISFIVFGCSFIYDIIWLRKHDYEKRMASFPVVLAPRVFIIAVVGLVICTIWAWFL